MKRAVRRRYCLLSVLSCVIFVATANAASEQTQTKTGTGVDMATVRNTYEAVKEFLATKGIEYGLKILAAVVIFFVGKWLAMVLANLISRAMTKARIEPTLVSFVKNVCYVGLVVCAAGLAVGLALQGSLSNFASGVLLVLFKPFKVGDFVELAGTKGTVQAIHIFNTVLNSPDNIRVTIPNAQVTGSSILNYTVNGSRRVDLVFGISYEDDIHKAKQVMEGVLAADNRVLKEPVPTVAVLELADSSVNFVCRPWVKPADYWDVYFDVTGKVKLALEAAGVTIPFPQQDVHIKGKTA